MTKIKRDIINDISEHLAAEEITLITGARQVGKTTLMNDLKKELENNGETTIFLSLDFEEDKRYFDSQQALINKLRLEAGNEKCYVFIDEIQRKENAGIFLKGIYDRKLPYKFIVSGSGSLELKEKIHESLAGRKRIFRINPVSFKEFINFKTEYRYENKLPDFFQIEKNMLFFLLDEYLNFGGYPRIITENKISEKTALMNEIYRSYIEKDIVYLLKIDRPEAYSRMIRMLAGNAGQMINLSGLASDTGISAPSLKKYLWYAEKTFFVHLVTPYYKNYRKEVRKSPVAYFNDHGMRNYALNLFGNALNSSEKGFVFQNFIFNLLRDTITEGQESIHYWRTTDKAEVDFIIDKKVTVLPVEVKYKTLQKPAVSRSFRSFIERYEPENAMLVNLSLNDEMIINNTHVRFVSFEKLVD